MQSTIPTVFWKRLRRIVFQASINTIMLYFRIVLKKKTMEKDSDFKYMFD